MSAREWLAAAGVLAFAAGAAEGQKIVGLVQAQPGGAAVSGVQVVLVDGALVERARAVTDSAGRFLLLAPGPGSYTLRFRHIGYEPQASQTLRLETRDEVEVRARIGGRAIPLPPVEVSVSRTTRNPGLADMRQRMRTGTGQFVTREEIEAQPGARTSDLFRRLSSVDLQPVRPANSEAGLGRVGHLVRVRGGGAGQCLADVYVDGIRVHQDRESTVDDFLHPGMLEAVEIHGAGTAPPGYAGGGCGVVLFWTREPETGGGWSWRRFAVAAGSFGVMFVLLR